MVVFGLAALAREPWQLAVAVLLIGFQLGNTGVMLAGIRDVTPRARLGTVIGLFGAAGPIGFAAGPALAGLLIDGAGWSLSAVFAVSAGLSLGTALLVGLGTREVRPEVVPQGRVLDLAFGAVRSVVRDPVVRRLFLVYGVVFLANQMSRPYTPVLVEALTGTGAGLATGIALVMGVASLVGAVVSPGAGWAGDRLGFRPVLIWALVGGGIASLLMPLMPGIGVLALVAVVLGAAVATVGAMVFSLLATEVPPERRSATLNLGYLPCTSRIVGPAIGAESRRSPGRAPVFLGALCSSPRGAGSAGGRRLADAPREPCRSLTATPRGRGACRAVFAPRPATTACARIAPCGPECLQVPNLLLRPRLRATRPGIALPGAAGSPDEASAPDVIQAAGVRWLNLERPREADRDWLEREFGFHPLAIEDVASRNQRPKLDAYDDYLFIVLHFPVFDKPTGRLLNAELDLFVGRTS